MRRQDGQALVMVLVATLALQVTAWAFVSRMNVEQRFAGGSSRSLAALYAADAGLQKALWLLEEGPPDASNGGQQDFLSQEALGPGAFAIEGFEHLPSGLIAITVRGESAGAIRRVKALVRAGPAVLGYGVYGHASMAFSGRARIYIVPCRAGASGCRSGGDLAGGGTVWFDNPEIALNDFRSTWLSLRDRTMHDRELLGASTALDPTAGLVDIVLAGTAQLENGPDQTPVAFDDLRRVVHGLGVRRLRTSEPLRMPAIDVKYYKALARENTANAMINSAAGFWDKRDSQYTEDEFEVIVDYLKDRPARPLQGVVFVEGDVLLEEGARLSITDGALILQGGLEVGPGARFEVRHSDTTRVLPGIVAGGGIGSLFVRKEGMAAVDGLILVDKDLQVDEGVLDVIGAVVAGNFVNNGGTAVVRYDSTVLSTVGLRRMGRGRTELLSWQELR